MPVEVGQGGMLEAELTYGNKPSAVTQADRVHDSTISDVIRGRALVFDVDFIRESFGVRISPLGVVEGPKFRINHPQPNIVLWDRASV